jgi:hypothetical protein
VTRLHRSRASVTAFAAVALAATSSSAIAQSKWVNQVDLPVTLVRDSNPTMTTGKPTAVTRYQASPSVLSTYSDGADEIALSGGVTLERNVPQVALNRQDPRLRAEWRHITPRASGNAYALYEQSAYRNLALVESIPLGVDGTRRLSAVGGGLTREMTESGTVTLNARQDTTRFSTPGTTNYGLTSASAQYTQAIKESSAWYVTADTQRYKPESGLGVSRGGSRSDGVLVGYKTSLWDNKLQVDGAAGRLRFAGTSSNSSWQGSLKVTYLRAFTDLSFEVSRRSAPLISTSALGAITVLKVASKTTISEDTSVLLDFTRSTTNAFPRSVADSLSLGLSRQLSARANASLRAERRAREDAVFGRAHTTILTASLSYSFFDF